MNREIKFRFWDIQNKEMIYPNLYFFEEMGIRTSREAIDRGFIPFQFTGLLDKNGEEVYEGDIIKQHYSNTYGLVKFGVHSTNSDDYYNSEACGWYYENIKSKTVSLLPRNEINEVEVIGNIYENPELLEEREDG
jgi:uncharacterized phage protein (TIGR01671 family)